MKVEFSFHFLCRGVWSFHPLRPAQSHIIWESQLQLSAAAAAAAALEQLLIKCLARGHPRVIGSTPQATYTHIDTHRLPWFSTSVTHVAVTKWFFFSRNSKSEITRVSKHLGSDLISSGWVACKQQGENTEGKNRKEKKLPLTCLLLSEKMELCLVFSPRLWRRLGDLFSL